jgi:hypothetical protein
MKNLMLVVVLALAGNTAFAQNTLTVQNKTAAGVVGMADVVFTDNSKTSYTIEGPGEYTFDIGTREILTVSYGGIPCRIKEMVIIPMASGGTASCSLKLAKDSERNMINTIR